MQAKRLALGRSSCPVDPDLARYGISITDDDVELARARIEQTGIHLPIEVVDGKVASLACAVEMRALEGLGRHFEPIEVELRTTKLEYVMRGLRPEIQRSETVRACIGARMADDYKALGRARMSEAGRRGAARRWGSSRLGEPHDEPKYEWHTFAAPILRVPAHTLKRFNSLLVNAPEMFRALEDGRLDKVANAEILVRGFESPADRLACLSAWRTACERNSKAGPSAKRIIRLLSYLPEYRRSKRRLDAVTKSSRVSSPRDMKGPGYELRWGTMEERGACKHGSIDIDVADVVYEAGRREDMSAKVARHSLRDLAPGGWLILCAGTFGLRGVMNAVHEAAPEFDEAIVLHVTGHDGKPSPGNLRGCVAKIDGMPYLAYRKPDPGGKRDSGPTIARVHFESETQAGGEVYSAWSKNPRVLADIFEALFPPKTTTGTLRIRDMCMGWGASGVAARRIGASFVGIECSNDDNRYVTACRRIAEARPGVWPEARR